MSEGKRSSKAKDDEAVRQELRRFKNREAARRVRERKSNQLNTYKNQVDELKRENQKLLQIIQQLQDASLSGGAGLALAACEPSCTQPGHDASGCPAADSADDSNPTGPHAAALAAAAAGAAAGPPDGICGQLAWAATLSPRTATTCGGSPEADSQRLEAATHSDSGLASGPHCVMSQPALLAGGVVAMLSSSLPGTLSAPLALGHAGASSSFVPPSPRALEQHSSVQLLRSCGCKGDQECAECEGVRVTLASSSSLPLVTTPGPRPKRLTLEDLRAPVRRLLSADGNATSASLNSASHVRQPQHHSALQVQQLKLDPACMDLVQTLEPSKAGGGGRLQQQQAPAAANGHSSTGNTVASFASPRAMQQLLAASSSDVCYVRKSAVSRSTSATAAAAAAAAASASGLAAAGGAALFSSTDMDLCCKPAHEQQQQEQGKQKLRRKDTSCDTASAAAAAAAAGSSGSFGATGLSGSAGGHARQHDNNNGDASNAMEGDHGNTDVLGYFPCSREMVHQLAALHQEQHHHQQQLQQQQQPALGMAAMAIDPPSTTGVSPQNMAMHPQLQQQSGGAGAAGGGAGGSGKAPHKAPKLLRSIAAVMNGWVRSNSGSLKAAGGAGPAVGRVGRSASATAAPGPEAQQQQQQVALAHARHASDPAEQSAWDATAAVAAAAQQQQQRLLAPALHRGGGHTGVCLPQECQHQPPVHLEQSLFLGSFEPAAAAASRSGALLHGSCSGVSGGVSGSGSLRPPALSWPCNTAFDAGAWQAAQQQQQQLRGAVSAATTAAAAAALARSGGPLCWGPSLEQQGRQQQQAQVSYLPAGYPPAAGGAAVSGPELLLGSLRAMEEDGPLVQQDPLQQDPLDDPVMMLALQEGVLLVDSRLPAGAGPRGLL